MKQRLCFFPLICAFYNFHKTTTRCLSLAVPAVKRKLEKATDSEHYCATQFLIFSSLTSSDKLYLSLSHSVLPLLISQFSPGAPEVYKCSSASLQYELISNLAARRSEGKIDTKTHSLQKQVEECRTKYSYHKNIYKDHVTGSKHRVALFC